VSIPDSETQFSQLFADFYGRVHAYAARRVGATAADEIAAETFLVAWRRFDAIPDEPLPWLYGVARNVVRRERSAQARQDATSRALQSEPAATPPIDTEVPGLWEAWQALNDGDREVLALIAWEELPVRDAARSLGCSAPVFSVRLHRARRRFEKLLDGRPAAPRPLADLPEAS
jgi:RNA polymerase sigma-70 factor (ECF subfamily)